MSFWSTEPGEFLEEAIKILNRMGHKFDGTWYPVRHGPQQLDYMKERWPEPMIIDAYSIECVHDNCKLRFDINASYTNEMKSKTFLLWHKCRGLAQYKWTGSEYETISEKESQEMLICKRFQVLK